MKLPRCLTPLCLGAALPLCWSAPVRAQGAAFVATVTADSTDLHKSPSATSAKIGSASSGTKLSAFGLSPDHKWVRVKDDSGTAAWVSRSAVSVAKAGGEPAPVPSATPVAHNKPTPTATPMERPGPGGPKKYGHTVTRTKVLLNATSSAPSLATAGKGDVFEVGGLSADKQWVKVRTEDGRIGWIARADIRPGRTGPEVIGGFGHSEEERRKIQAAAAAEDPPPRRVVPPSAGGGPSNVTIWADGGAVLISEKVTSDEGYGYLFSGKGFGGGIRFQKQLGDGGLFFDGGFLGTANQRVAVPGSGATVFSMLYRLDLDLRYRYSIMGGEEGPSVWGLGGFQNYTFYFQPQSISYFYSEIYDGGELGVGGDYGLMGGTLRPFVELQYYVPVLVAQRYGNGGNGGDGQSSRGSGYGLALGVTKQLGSGARLGLSLRGSYYNTSWTGQGVLGTQPLHGVTVSDSFQAITFTYARGF